MVLLKSQLRKKDKLMIDGKLCASANAGNYAVGSPYNPDLTVGQVVELFLGGYWIPGRITSSDYSFDASSSTVTSTRTQSIGAYQLPSDDVEDTVTEASEESFPASDSPAWTADTDRSEDTINIGNGYYFVADADSSICGLCIGMHIRIKDTFTL